MEIILQLVITFVVGLVGVAVGFGMMKNQVNVNKNNIRGLKKELKEFSGNPGGRPVFMSRDECDERTQGIEKEIRSVKRQIESHGESIKGVQNFARWILTKKEGLDLVEVNKILNGD